MFSLNTSEISGMSSLNTVVVSGMFSPNTIDVIGVSLHPIPLTSVASFQLIPVRSMVASMPPVCASEANDISLC